MRFYILIIFLFIVSCCPAQNKNKAQRDSGNLITYILPSSVEQLLQREINKKGNNIYFHLQSDSDAYIIYISEIDDKSSTSYWIRTTNRKLFLNGAFFPLIFDLDEVFATTENNKQVLKKYFTEKYLTINKTFTLFHGFHIRFKSNGEILSSGYE
jgi:hypothetical protein